MLLRAAGAVTRRYAAHAVVSAQAGAVRANSGPAARKQHLNWVLNIVPHEERWVIERLGKFHAILEPGFSLLIPVIDKIAYKHSLKQVSVPISDQRAITQDNVQLHVDGVLYYTVKDAMLASYGVEDVHYAIKQLAESTMRSELGKRTLDRSLADRDTINHAIVQAINAASSEWGVEVKRYEIRDVSPPANVLQAMELQVAAERQKRAAILQSEGVQQSSVNVAEGVRTKMILESQGQKEQLVNQAAGEASAILARATATAASLEAIAAALARVGGKDAASLTLAHEYINAFAGIARTSTTVVMPGDTSDISSLVAKAMGVYGAVSRANAGPVSPGSPAPVVVAAPAPASVKAPVHDEAPADDDDDSQSADNDDRGKSANNENTVYDVSTLSKSPLGF